MPSKPETESSPVIPPVRIGVSSCLLGEPVRWDGQDRRHGYVTEVLAGHVDLVPLCPEVGIGLGVPREPIRLVRHGKEVRAVDVKDPSRDVTDDLRAFAKSLETILAGLHGYIFKARSPSCGVLGVELHFPTGRGASSALAGVGIFAAAVMAHNPSLPIEEEGGLDDPGRRARFIARVFARAGHAVPPALASPTSP